MMLLYVSCDGQKYDYQSKLKKYNDSLTQGTFTQDVYLTKTDYLLFYLWYELSENIPHELLVEMLTKYKEIAWSNKKFDLHKAIYYGHFATNANLQGRAGEAVFFAGKYDEQMKNSGEESFLKNVMVINHYQASRNYTKIIEFYEANEEHIFNLAVSGKLSGNDLVNQINTVGASVDAYIHTKQFSKAKEQINKLNKLNDIVQKDPKAGLYSKTLSYVQGISPEVKLSLALNLKQEALLKINDGIKHLNENKESLGSTYADFMNVFNDLKVEYYTQYNDFKSAQRLLHEVKPTKYLLGKDSLFLSRKAATLQANMGKYKEAFYELQSNLTRQEEKAVILTNQMDELLFAHAEAEFNRNELDFAQKDKRAQLYWMFGIGFLLTSLLIRSLILRIKEKRKTEAIILQLNQLTDVMVEEAKKEAAKEEKRKLGQDLHDDLSGSLASLLHVIKGAESETKEPGSVEKFEHIFERTNQIYERIRTKSHVMYDLSESSANDSLGKNIKKIVDTALPDKDFSKEIEIDPSVASLLPSSTRIEVLRIVQEAINNILKHAKKASNVFVFLYKEMDTVTLQISDDGKQVSLPTAKKGIGLSSIADRVKALGGQLKIETGSGMNLTILFPLV